MYENIAFFITFVVCKIKLMKKILFLVCLVTVVMLFAACTTLRTITYDRLQAADINYPEQVRKVGVVNFMPVHDADAEQADRLPFMREGDGKLVTDKLAQQIAATHYFEEVVVCDSVFQQDGKWANGEVPQGLVDSLGKELGVDVLFAMEHVYIQFKEGTLFAPALMATVPAVDAVITPLLTIYLPGREKPLFTVSKSDSIAWEMTPMLSYEQVMKDASEYAATIPMSYLLPYWKTMERVYFDGGNVDMRDAGVYVRESNWEDASLLWRKVYDQKKGKAKMRAAFNLAVYSEVQDDYEQASTYLDEALSLTEEGSWERALILHYQVMLQEQAHKNNLLKIQMKRFE